MKKYVLSATIRDLVGRKVKTLRKQGMVPATIYGKSLKSVSVTVTGDEFGKLYKEAGDTGLIELTIDGQARPVLVHHLQRDPISGGVRHIEFHQVDLKEKVSAQVPIELVGEAPAVAQKLGVLLSVLDEVEVEALPTDLPEYIAVDLSSLAQVNDEIKVSDLKVAKNVIIQTGPALTVVKIGTLITKEAQAQAEAEEAAAAAAKATEAPPVAEEQVAAPAPTEQPPSPSEKE